MTNNYRELPANERKMMRQVEAVKDMLNYCIERNGATIKVTVTHDNGLTASATLYDHAALVQGLLDALNYFQSEL